MLQTIFKPINEFMVQQLCVTEMAFRFLKIMLVGPVLSPSGKRLDSPDCWALHMRNGTTKLITVECKHTVTAVSDFSHNGKFDMAIVWDTLVPRRSLEDALRENHGCQEVIVLNDLKPFRELPDYTEQNILRLQIADTSRKSLENRQLPAIAVALFAANKQQEFSSDEAIDFLTKENIIDPSELSRRSQVQQSMTSLVFAKILIRNRKHWFRWNQSIPAELALPVITELYLRSGSSLPTI